MSVFERNLSILVTRDPELAALMSTDINTSHIEVIPSHQPEVPTARVTLPSGERLLLHNTEDPIGSAKRTAEKQEMKAENASILLGFGLGYLARELAMKLEKKHPMIICEMDPAILKTALTHVDLSPVLNSDFIRILVGPEISLQRWIQRLQVKFMTAKVEAISYEPSVRTNPEAYERLKEVAQKESRAIILNRNTTLKAGRLLMENLLNNFPEVLHSAGVKHLTNLFQGRPAVMVAAGPSLEKNVHLLKKVEGRAVIIAVDTTLRLLLPLGIKPDIVTTIDFNQKNFEKFSNVPIPSDISLVYHAGGYYESIRAFHGPRFTSCVNNQILSWLLQFVEDKGSLPPGTTVAHLSFHLARHLGCDPIVMIGQDLAFPLNKVHASDLSLWRIDPGEMDTIEDIFGDPVGSMTSFKHAIYHFEKAFKETKATVIDATEAGAKKQGALVMLLQDVVHQYGDIPPIDIKGKLRQASEHPEAVHMTELMRELKFVSAELSMIQEDCREIMKVVRRLRKKIDAGETEDQDFVKLTYVAEKLTQEINSRGRVLNLMGEQNFSLELYMLRHVAIGTDEIEDIDEKIKQQVERAEVYYPSVADASAAFKRSLDKLIQKLSVAATLHDSNVVSLRTAEDWYQRAFSFKKIDSSKDAILAVQNVLALDPEHVAALKLLCRLSLETNRLDLAEDGAHRLSAIRKAGDKVQALIAEVRTRQEAWAQRCAQLKAEFGEKPTRSLEEAGWFYYRVKDYVRAIERLERAASETPSAGIYCRLGQAKAKSGDIAGAMEAFQSGIAMDSTSAELYKEVGELSLEQGLKQEAELFFQEAVRIEPDDAVCWESLGRLYSDRGAYAEAGLCYEQLLRLHPDRQQLIPQIAALYQRQIGLAVNTQ
jgi:predicted Zn-dependent protease